MPQGLEKRLFPPIGFGKLKEYKPEATRYLPMRTTYPRMKPTPRKPELKRRISGEPADVVMWANKIPFFFKPIWAGTLTQPEGSTLK